MSGNINGLNIDGSISTQEMTDSFGELIAGSEKEIEEFMAANTSNGVLELSSSAALELQGMMTDLSMVTTTGTNVVKKHGDGLLAAARNM